MFSIFVRRTDRMRFSDAMHSSVSSAWSINLEMLNSCAAKRGNRSNLACEFVQEHVSRDQSWCRP